jgi:Arc/MetJ-type ribon-helix-helix transcriptional regulator
MTEIVAGWPFMYYKNLMQKRPVKKRSRGRPPTGHDRVITVRLPKKLIRTLDKQAAAESKTRSEVIRALLDPHQEIRRQVGAALVDTMLDDNMPDETISRRRTRAAAGLTKKELAAATRSADKRKSAANSLANKELRAAVARSKST